MCLCSFVNVTALQHTSSVRTHFLFYNYPQATVTALWQKLRASEHGQLQPLLGEMCLFVFKMSEAFTNGVNGLLTGLHDLLQHCVGA